ncbi:MAG: 2-oxo acid dehydrogenase subunit E2 [Polyangiaceae bacterium]|nr:2-oxo acid dehydrogenase subunit E2 [Polyangiaceae bacterium]
MTRLAVHRKLALGTWRTSYDPAVYGDVEIRMDSALEYIAAFRRGTGKRLTVSHLFARAAAAALAEVPEANAVLRWNRIYLRERIGVFFQIAIEAEGEEPDLSGATIYDAEKKSLHQICDEVDAKVAQVRARNDPALEQARMLFQRVPEWLMPETVRVLSFLHNTLNLDLSALGVPNDPFGSVMITNIGSLGLEGAYAPLVPYSGVPFVLTLGAVKDAPIVHEGRGVSSSVSA